MFFSWIALLSIIGITVGVAAMIIVLSVINGFETELRNRFLAANAHVLVYNSPYGINNYDDWAHKITSDFAEDVRGTSPFVHYETMVKADTTSNAILIRGIHPQKRAKVQSLKNLIFPSSALDVLQAEIDAGIQAQPAIIVGKGLLEDLGGKVGELLYLVAPSDESLTTLQAFKVVGVYSSGLRHYDSRVGIVSLVGAQRLFDYQERVTGIEVGLHNPQKSPQIANAMKDRYILNIAEWQSFNRPFFEAMRRERVVIAIIVALVAIVAIFNIFTTLFVSVSQKIQDISVLKSLGATNKQVNAIFLKQGCLIGILGNCFGVLLAGVFCFLLKRFQFVSLPEKVYHISDIPIEFDIWVYLGVCCVSIVCCLIAGFYPARVATRTSPLEMVRSKQ